MCRATHFTPRHTCDMLCRSDAAGLQCDQFTLESAMQAQHENGTGEESSGLINVPAKKRGFPMSAEERRIRRKEINRESARRIRKRKNNEMEGLKQQVLHPFVYQFIHPLITCFPIHRSGVSQ